MLVASSPDRAFAAILRVNGSEDPELYKCLERVVVNEDLTTGASFEVEIELCRNDDGSWPRVDDPALRPWNRVTIVAGFPTHQDTIIDGYISSARVTANKERGAVTLSITGVDGSYAMNLEEVTKVWKEKTVEEIAEAIVDLYGFTFVGPKEAPPAASGPPPAITQRDTDHAFLQELARRVGYEFFVRGGEAHFHPAELSGTPQKLIVAEFGDETNCDDLQVVVDGTRATRAVMRRVDPLTGKPESHEATDSGLPALGTTELASMRGAGGLKQASVFVRRQGAASEEALRRYVSGILRREGWMVKATGTVDGARYGRVLRSQRLVTIKGLGKAHNGNYYVRKVTHTMGPRSYQMAFEAYRNRIGQLGSEPFVGETPSPLAVPALGAGPEPSTSVRASGALVLPA